MRPLGKRGWLTRGDVVNLARWIFDPMGPVGGNILPDKWKSAGVWRDKNASIKDKEGRFWMYWLAKFRNSLRKEGHRKELNREKGVGEKDAGADLSFLSNRRENTCFLSNLERWFFCGPKWKIPGPTKKFPPLLSLPNNTHSYFLYLSFILSISLLTRYTLKFYIW